jgi:hypothetical protein
VFGTADPARAIVDRIEDASANRADQSLAQAGVRLIETAHSLQSSLKREGST